MNIFSRLLHLYRANGLKTPLEDFTTEILVGILSKNQEILNCFVNEVLEIPGDNFLIGSQEHFISDIGILNCRVDIIIRNDNIFCLLENKIGSSEGYEQLTRYGKILDKYNNSYETYLRYCTKFYDKKDFRSHNFLQFRWHDISKFLKKWESTELINDYLQFLKEHHMDYNTTFSASDIIALENFNPLVLKMDAYLQKIKPGFEKQFGRTKDQSNLKQIKDHSRYIFIKERPFGNGYNEIGVGFDFKEAPLLTVWVWCGKENNNLGLFKERITSSTLPEKFINNGKDWISLRKPLTDFISSRQVEVEIEEWFFDSFKLLYGFTQLTAELQWNLG